jgi:hypothetical protein
MTVVAFTPRARNESCNGWRPLELTQIVDSISAEVASRKIAGWDVGTTEAGDPQFYVLTALPDNDCVLCISRLGATYVLEDGRGSVLCERDDLAPIMEAAKKQLRRGRFTVVARVMVVWFAVRQSFEEKVDAVLVESEELLMHVAPQLAAII